MIVPLITESVDCGCEDQVQQKLDRFGIVAIRHATHDHEKFLQFSNRTGSDFISHSLSTSANHQRVIGGNSGRSIVKNEKTLFSTTGTHYNHEVLVHGELYFQQSNPPGRLWFFCEIPPKTHGETIFCDGGELFEQLPEDIQRLLLTSNLVYHRQHDESTWQQLYQTSNKEALREYCKTNQLRLEIHADNSISTTFVGKAVHQFNARPVFINNFLPFAHRQLFAAHETRARVLFENGKEVDKELFNEIYDCARLLTVMHSWQHGDIVVVDNRRILHGRNRLDGSDRKVYVRMSKS